MQYGVPTKRLATVTAFGLIAAIMTPLPLLAQDPHIKFTTFNVPGSTGGELSVEGINNRGEIVGGYTISSGTFGFLRSPSGGLAPGHAWSGAFSPQGRARLQPPKGGRVLIGSYGRSRSPLGHIH